MAALKEKAQEVYRARSEQHTKDAQTMHSLAAAIEEDAEDWTIAPSLERPGGKTSGVLKWKNREAAKLEVRSGKIIITDAQEGKPPIIVDRHDMSKVMDALAQSLGVLMFRVELDEKNGRERGRAVVLG